MKYRLFLIMTTLVGLGSMTFSCSQDDDLVTVSNKDQRTPISFNVNVDSLSDTEVTTRGGLTNVVAGTGYAFAANDWVTMAIKASVSSPVTTSRGSTEVIKTYRFKDATDATAGKLTYLKDADNNTTYEFNWLSTQETISIRAWSYGDGSTNTDPVGSYTLNTNQQTNGYNEILYYEGDCSYGTNGSINISLQHVLSRVVITINYDSGSSLNAITIGDGVMTLPTTASFDTSEATLWKDFGTEKGVVTPKTETANSVYSAVLIPTTYAQNDKFINITIGSETFAYKLPANITLQAGKQYNYTITIKNKAIVTECTIADWGTGTTGGTVTINTLQ